MKKNSIRCRARDSNLEPLVYEASVLPTELSFRTKNLEKLMTKYTWFVTQQMLITLTYPFNIVQYTLSHIVEHCKLDSLATPDNIIWSTVTACWTSNVRQFDSSLWNTTQWKTVYHWPLYLRWEAGVIRSQWSNFLPSWLTDSLVFSDRETKVADNLRIEDMNKRFSNCAFLYVQSYVSTDNKCVEFKQFSTWSWWKLSIHRIHEMTIKVYRGAFKSDAKGIIQCKLSSKVWETWKSWWYSDHVLKWEDDVHRWKRERHFRTFAVWREWSEFFPWLWIPVQCNSINEIIPYKGSHFSHADNRKHSDNHVYDWKLCNFS